MIALKRDRFTCVRPGCGDRARTVNHIQHRPRVPHPTEFDTPSNLESLCALHDGRAHPEKGQFDRGR